MQLNSVEDRIDAWARFRRSLTLSLDPLNEVSKFWSDIKTIPYNRAVDPYNQNSWPTPWEIIADNCYDEMTLAIMIGYTIKLIDKFANSRVEIRTLVDSTRTRLYNLVYVDDQFVLNYMRGEIVVTQDIPDSFFLENLVELARPR
jgi:hypothetical protein